MKEKKTGFFLLWLILAILFGVGICSMALLPLSLQTTLHAFGQKTIRFLLGLIFGEELLAKIPSILLTLVLFSIGNAFLTWFVWLAACRKPEQHYKALLPALYTGALITVMAAFVKWIVSGEAASWSTISFLFFGCILALAGIALYWFCWDHFPKIVNRETVRYVIFGVMATIVNLVTFNLCYYVFNLNKGTSLATIIAWVVAVIFAFFTNKVFVFESKTNGIKEITKEAALFFGARLFSCLVTIVGMFLLVDLTHWFSAGVGKVINCIIELTLNYIFSKLIIFTKPKGKN